MRKPGIGCMIAVLAGLAGCVGPTDGTIPIDDSYTVSSRYLSNREQHPELTLPRVTMVDGQTILFDRLYRTIGSRELHLDAFLPPPGKARRQAIVLLHGGAWRSGNKSNFYAIASLLAQRGYAVFLPEFRLAPEARYPAGMVDINAAINWVSSHADEFGFDPGRIAVGGESTGGQMAGLIAYTGGSTMFTADGRPAAHLNALIDIDGVLDMTAPLALQNENRGGAKSPAALWLGGSFEQVPEKWREASAASHLSADSPPTLVISGGQARFTAGIEDVLPKLTSLGIGNRNVNFPGLPHTFWLFEPYASQVVEAIDDFLRQAGDIQPAGSALQTGE